MFTGQRCYNVSGNRDWQRRPQDAITPPPTPPKTLQKHPKTPPKTPPKQKQYTQVTTVLPLEGRRHQKHAMRSKEQTVNEPISFSWWSLRVENLSWKHDKILVRFCTRRLKLPPQKRTKPTRNQSKINTKTNPKLTLVAKYHPTWKNWAPKCCKYHGKWEVRTPKCWPLKWWPSGSPLPPLQRTPCLELNVGLPVTGISPKKWMNWWKSTWFSEFLQDCWIIY